MKWPSISDVARELRLVNENVEVEDTNGCDVRLQVYEAGDWAIHAGSSDYDLDHHGYWGASSVPGVVNGVVKRFNSRYIARDLLEQAKDNHGEATS